MDRRLGLIVLLATTTVPAHRPLAAQVAATIELRGPAGQHRTIGASDLASMKRVEAKASAHGVAGTFSGVSLGDLVRLVGAPQGDSLRGAALASYVLVEAADGYRATFTLAEFNPSFTDRVLLLADRKDGVALDAHDGPFQIVVPDEKRPARWVRMVTRITVVMLPTPARP